jgi:C-terminal processing protease CtpA/Prc
VGRIAALDLGGFELSNVVASYPISEHQNPGGMDSRNGNLGNDILKRFNVTFDYQQKRMLLEPNQRYDDPFEFDMSGIVFQQDDERGVYIESILPDSPARDAGLRPDDVILTVNGADAAAVGYMAIREQLRKDGENVTIRYRRGKKVREVSIKLRRLV